MCSLENMVLKIAMKNSHTSKFVVQRKRIMNLDLKFCISRESWF